MLGGCNRIVYAERDVVDAGFGFAFDCRVAGGEDCQGAAADSENRDLAFFAGAELLREAEVGLEGGRGQVRIGRYERHIFKLCGEHPESIRRYCSGCRQRNPLKRLKSPSVVIHSQPDSIAKAAR